MTLWVRIVDGVLVDSGDLPTVPVRRLDTGQLVNLSADGGEKWARAAGYYDITTVDPLQMTDDPAKQAALTEDLADTAAGSTGRGAFLAKIDQSIQSLLSNSWDFLDAYSDRIWPGQQTAGASWPQFDTTPPGSTLQSVGTYLTLRTNVLAARAEILRTQESFNTFALIRLANFLQVLREVLSRLITDDPDIVPPPDR